MTTSRSARLSTSFSTFSMDLGNLASTKILVYMSGKLVDAVVCEKTSFYY